MASDTKMLGLGDYRFSVDTAAYQELVRTSEYRWQAQERLRNRPAQQYLGPGEESIGLTGILYPAYRGGLGQLDAIRAEAGQGQPLMLTSGSGDVLGKWCITQVEETRRIFDHDGTPRQVEFRLRIVRYGEDNQVGG